MTYRSGQRVRIVGNSAFHHFEIGEIVTLHNYFPEGHGRSGLETSETHFIGFWSTSPNPHDGGCVHSLDIELVEEGKRLTGYAKWKKKIDEHLCISS